MSETDLSKMKVADLKRELKLRGLSITGNKNELQDRLQAALLGDGSLDDSTLATDDLLDDGILSDEDEDKILHADEDILKSPLATPDSTEKPLIDDDILESPTIVAKKICLKRQFSGGVNPKENEKSKENTEPTERKVIKMSERNPISVSDLNISRKATTETNSSLENKKVSGLTLEERLAIRAKKFGVTTPAAPNTTVKTPERKNQPIDTSSLPKVTDEKQIEILKKRAERFGCVTSSQIAKIEAQERLNKRKERFTSGVEASPSSTSNESWSEKAQKRLERFKTTEVGSNGSTATKVEV